MLGGMISVTLDERVRAQGGEGGSVPHHLVIDPRDGVLRGINAHDRVIAYRPLRGRHDSRR
jgi:hypothetical protein